MSIHLAADPDQELRRILSNTVLHLRTIASLEMSAADRWEETRKTASQLLAACPVGKSADRGTK